METKADKKKKSDRLVTIEACVCGSETGKIVIDHEDGLRVPIVVCYKCGLEIDHTIYSMRSTS